MDKVCQATIDKFIELWESGQQVLYAKVADQAREKCETLLTKEGIQAEFKNRPKATESLRQKCTNRVMQESKYYPNIDAIYEDIIDLAGVRIALYFPRQKESVHKLIKGHFEVIEEKEHPENEQERASKSGKKQAEPYSRGYTATHYRVRLKPAFTRSGEEIIEIQVMSVLHHAWANVRHDITYKALSGKVSKEERNILNGLNNLLFTGEWFLDTFYETHITRAGAFTNHFQLGAYLSQNYSEVIQQGNGGMKLGLVKVMYNLLERLVDAGVELPGYDQTTRPPKLNTPQGLDIVTKDLSFEDRPNSTLYNLKEGFGQCELTISVYIMIHILDTFKTVANWDRAPDACRERLHIMLSTLVWLDELFPTSLVFEHNLFRKCSNDEKRLIKWMYKHPTDPRSVLLFPDDRDNIRKRRTKAYVDEAWEFFTRSTTHGNPVVEFAFNLARRGVLYDYEETFTRFIRRQVDDDLPFPDWYQDPAFDIVQTESIRSRRDEAGR